MNAITPMIRPGAAGLLTPSAAYKPFRYPWAFDMWKKQQQVHWMPEEVPLGEDMKDWAVNLNDRERNLLTQIFRFFTQSDIEVADNYMEKYGRVFKPTEVKMMLSSFANMETIHIAAYALLLLLPHVEGPRIAERLVGRRGRQQAGGAGADDRGVGVHRAALKRIRGQAFTMRPDAFGAKSKCGYVAITFVLDARCGVSASRRWGEDWG